MLKFENENWASGNSELHSAAAAKNDRQIKAADELLRPMGRSRKRDFIISSYGGRGLNKLKQQDTIHR